MLRSSYTRSTSALLITGVLCCPALAQDETLESLLATEGGPSQRPTGGSAADNDEPAETGMGSPEVAPATTPKASRQRVIEEIIVTAQRRNERLQDVPISMSVFDDEFLKQQSVTDFRDVTIFTPNVRIDSSGRFPDINIRGFGTSLGNRAFEESVALVLDGIPYGNQLYFMGPIFDIDRVEVLRGPQGTLFGKNTTGGVFNLTTNKPTDDFTGIIDGRFGELGQRRVEAAIGGPIVKNLVNFRLSALQDKRDGLTRNTTAAFVPGANNRMNNRDREGIRAQIGFPDVLGADLVLSYEKVNVGIVGAGWEFQRVTPNELRFFREWDPHVDVDPENFVGSIDAPENLDNKFDTFVATGHYDLGGWGLETIVGHANLESRNFYENDFTPAPMINNRGGLGNLQTTFELRLDSPGLPGFFGLTPFSILDSLLTDFTAGFFYQRRSYSGLRIYEFYIPVLAQFIAFGNTPSGAVPPLQDFIGPEVSVGSLGIFDTRSLVDESTMHFDQVTNSIAGFGQTNWRFWDRYSLQFGLRFTQERKDAHWNQAFTNGPGVFPRALQEEEFTLDRTRAESALTPKVSLRYDIADGIHLFGSWTRGFKAGGFNEEAANPNSEDELVFKAENAMAWELGAKMEFLDGAAMLNVGLFRQTVEDLQVFTVTPQLTAVVRNAGEARSQGVEVDSTWLPTSWLTIMGSLAFDDAKYLEFPLGSCPMDAGLTPLPLPVVGVAGCDLSGRQLYRTPQWTSTLATNVRFPLDAWSAGAKRLALLPLDGIDLIGGLTVEYKDMHSTDRTLDFRTRQPAFFRLNGNVGFGNPTQGWSVRVGAENLTDQIVAAQSRDVTLGRGSAVHILDPPRLFFGEIRWSF